MKASEAQQISLKYHEIVRKGILCSVYNIIRLKAECGEFVALLEFGLNEAEKQILKKEGYNVSVYTNNPKYSIRISW